MGRFGRILSVATAAIAVSLPCAATHSIRNNVRREAAVLIKTSDQDRKTITTESPLSEFSLEPERLPNPNASLQRLMNDIDLATGGESVTY